MFRTFNDLRFCLMVGVGGGIPSDEAGVRLGDVVVSIPHPKQNAVVQHDFGKTDKYGFVRTHSLNAPPRLLLNAINRVRTEHDGGNYGYLRYMSSVPESIHLALSIPVTGHSQTDRQIPRIFYGTIASGNQLISTTATRDSLRVDLEALCIEMEAGGLMDDFRCLVIRGICDYSDSSKNKEWQGSAVLAAAAYAKELLSFVEPEEATVTSPLSSNPVASTVYISARLLQLNHPVKTSPHSLTHQRSPRLQHPHNRFL